MNGNELSLHQLYLALLVGGFVLLASIVGTRVATRVGFPSLLLFLLVGVVLGEDGARVCSSTTSNWPGTSARPRWR